MQDRPHVRLPEAGDRRDVTVGGARPVLEGEKLPLPLGEPREEWTVLAARIDEGRGLGHWGGANDGIVHHPIRWDAVILVDSIRREAHSGEIEVRDITLIEDR